MDIQDNNQTGASGSQQDDIDQDGTLHLQPTLPGSAEGTIFLKSPELQNIKIEKYTEVAPIAETSPQENAPIPEVLKAPETEVQKVETIAPETQPTPPPTPVVTTIAEEPKNIVDLRTSHETLHDVPKIADKYTAKADEEENLFINEVEKQHEHQ